jgi:hypothetical protein
MNEKFVAGLAAELGKARLVPGNEAGRAARLIIDWIEKNDKDMVQAQVDQDSLDVEEVKKDTKAIMQAIVAMSKVLEGTNKGIGDLKTILQTGGVNDKVPDSPTD